MKANCYYSILLLFYAALCLIFLACDNCSDTIDAPITLPIKFSIVDPMGNNLVDTIQSYYALDGIKLFDLEAKDSIYLTHLYIPAAGGYVFFADCRKNGNGKSSLILRMNSLDSDTLDIWYKQKDNKCFALYEYTHFQHNGRDLQKPPLNSVLLITKAN